MELSASLWNLWWKIRLKHWRINLNKISVFGNSGFIGSRFCSMFPEEIVKIPRGQRESETNEILNFISTTHNYNIYDDVLKDLDTNVVTMLQILDSAKKKFGNDFVFNQVSTWSVYGNVELPAKEECFCNPTGFYSITKRTAEQMLIAYCKIFDIKYRIFRLCNVIGESDKIVPKKKNALQYLINELKENREVNLYHNGDFLREYMYVDDICSAMHLCINKGNTNEIYNIGNGKKTVFGDLINYCKKHLNSTSKVNRIGPSKFHDIVQTKDMYLDVSKIKSLGFKPKTDVYKALDVIMDNKYLLHDQKGSDMKINLPDVTLLAISSIEIPATIKALQISAEKINFAKIVLVSDVKPDDLPDNIEYKYYPKITNTHEFDVFAVEHLGEYFDTSHVLMVQYHGYVIHPELWDDDWLKYDFIGALWPERPEFISVSTNTMVRVGNGGFSLRSKKLYDTVEKLGLKCVYDRGYSNDDGLLNSYYRKTLIENGINYPLPEAVAKFSYENLVPENVGLQTFGFHRYAGAYN